jgi:uncharacterized protein (TIGR02466 family)
MLRANNRMHGPMPDNPASPKFERLWPTTIMRLRLPGADEANPLIGAYIEEQDRARADMTADYLGADLFVSDHPAVSWLKNCFDRAVLDYARGTGVDHDLEWTIQAWPNVNRFGDYHNLHNHPHSWLSGTYYVSVPEDDAPLHGRSDRNPNAISFFDPRPQANMLAIRGDPQVDPEYRVRPRAGDLLVWPAFLHHLVHVNLSEAVRISVSFNVVLRWRDTYLPD